MFAVIADYGQLQLHVFRTNVPGPIRPLVPLGLRYSAPTRAFPRAAQAPHWDFASGSRSLALGLARLFSCRSWPAGGTTHLGCAVNPPWGHPGDLALSPDGTRAWRA